MKSFSLLLICLLSFSLCDAQPSEVPMTKVSGYFFSGEQSMLKPGVNFFLVQKKQEFEKLFGKGRSDTPRFSKEWMLVLVMPQTKKDVKMDFERISMKAGTFIEVYCDLNKLRGKLLTYQANPITVCVIPRYDNVKTINFYEPWKKDELRLVHTLEVKGR